MHLPPTPQLGGDKEHTMEELETDTDDEDDPAEESEDSENTNPSVPIPATRENAEWRSTVMDKVRRFTELESPRTNLVAERESPRAKLVAGAGSVVPNEPQPPITSPEERMAMIANVMALNQYIGQQPMFDIADAYTSVGPTDVTIQYQDDTVQRRFNTPTAENNDSEEDVTIESMPSLEPRDEEDEEVDEEEETVSTISSDDQFPLDSP